MEHGKPTYQASLIVDPPDGRTPLLTKMAQDQAAKVRAERQARGNPVGDKPEDQSFYIRCISRGVMGSILPVIYNNGNQIIQSPGMVAIRYEMIHETRMIPLDGRPTRWLSIRRTLWAIQRTSDKTIKYTATIDDPETWVKPWTVSYPLDACHEGNYGLLDILKGARAEEKKTSGK